MENMGHSHSFWDSDISKALKDGKNVVIGAHGNSLRALVKHVEQISDADIMGVKIANGEPWVYDLDEDLNVVSKKILKPEA
jgi:2,3-bisphosphoglycerate-dependent phosphoglycerate mutase